MQKRWLARSQPVSLSAGKEEEATFQSFKASRSCRSKIFSALSASSAVKALDFTLPPPMPRIEALESQSCPRPAPPPAPAHDRRGWLLRSQYPPDRNAGASPLV